MILDVGWLILQGSQINCILKVVRLIALNKEALRMQQRVMIKVYDYDQKGKNIIINNCGSCHLENAAANKGWKIRSPSVEYGALKGAYLCDCSLYTLEILMHAPKPYFTKATFSHRVDSTIYFLVTLIYYKGISNMQENMPSHNLKVLVVVPLQDTKQKKDPFFNHEQTT